MTSSVYTQRQTGNPKMSSALVENVPAIYQEVEQFLSDKVGSNEFSLGWYSDDTFYVTIDRKKRYGSFALRWASSNKHIPKVSIEVDNELDTRELAQLKQDITLFEVLRQTLLIFSKKAQKAKKE